MHVQENYLYAAGSDSSIRDTSKRLLQSEAVPAADNQDELLVAPDHFERAADEQRFPNSVRDRHTLLSSAYAEVNQASKPNTLSQELCRPGFRVQFKSYAKSNVGDHIEYAMCVQSLEGPRHSWVVYKRYTDFVQLHDSLSALFRQQLSKKAISKSDQVLPVIPPKIGSQDESEL